ncbi:trimeric intracellular cation channel family protein [Micrococcus terreus]|uniref:trimeric intracellular cation channel family protein n=1 Tax=Micrococcus terreus TaxID=574650 RepID=UPI003018E8B1
MPAAQVSDQLRDLADLLTTVQLGMDLVGVFFFAVSGGLLAARKGFDFVGSLFLCTLAGLGGGITRDILLDRGIPASFQDPVYLIPPALATLLIYLKVIGADRLQGTILVFDAAGLALFTVTGTMIALDHGAPPVSAVLIGTVGALGGGLLRDIVANEVPALFDPRGVYALPTVVGAILTVVLHELGHFGVVPGILVAVAVFAVRMLAYHFRWRLPGSHVSMDADSLERIRESAAALREVSARRLHAVRAFRRRHPEGPLPSSLSGPFDHPAETTGPTPTVDPEAGTVRFTDAESGLTADLDPLTGALNYTDPTTGVMHRIEVDEDGRGYVVPDDARGHTWHEEQERWGRGD